MQNIFKVGVDLTKPEVSLSTSWNLVLIVVAIVAAAMALRFRPWEGKAKPQLSLRKVTTKFRLPGTDLELTWEPDEAERLAAWELYVELVTRTTTVELADGQGFLREALDSYHSLFETTRRILRQYGPGVAVPKRRGTTSFGQLAVSMLNRELRPVLAKWHPLLSDWERRRGSGVTELEHEKQWQHAKELRQVMRDVRASLAAYAEILEMVAGVPSLIKQ